MHVLLQFENRQQASPLCCCLCARSTSGSPVDAHSGLVIWSGTCRSIEAGHDHACLGCKTLYLADHVFGRSACTACCGICKKQGQGRAHRAAWSNGSGPEWSSPIPDRLFGTTPLALVGAVQPLIPRSLLVHALVVGPGCLQ